MMQYVVCLILFLNFKVLVLAKILGLPYPNIFKQKLFQLVAITKTLSILTKINYAYGSDNNSTFFFA